jgi:integrase
MRVPTGRTLAWCSARTWGTTIDPGNLRRQYARLLQRARLAHVPFHGLRHTCASLLLAQRVHPRAVMETLGHSQIGLTMETYSHVMPTLRREVADQMDAILRVRG